MAITQVTEKIRADLIHVRAPPSHFYHHDFIQFFFFLENKGISPVAISYLLNPKSDFSPARAAAGGANLRPPAWKMKNIKEAMRKIFNSVFYILTTPISEENLPFI